MTTTKKTPVKAVTSKDNSSEAMSLSILTAAFIHRGMNTPTAIEQAKYAKGLIDECLTK